MTSLWISGLTPSLRDVNLVNDKGRYHWLSMDRELTPKPDEKFSAYGGFEAADDDLLDIDPADFVDPEEFISQRP
jgi:hypothetical protein